MGRKTILFVDDEPKILKGLQRILYPLKKEWNILLAESGAQALELLEQNPVDVVVSDMRMPVMNGMQLLSIIQKRYPKIVRVMLTGQPDRDMYCEVMTVSHYFIWKPASYEDLKALFEGIRELDAHLHDEKLLGLIGGMTSLPSLPALYVKLTEMLKNEESTTAEIAEIIEQDMAMTAQILKLVNSAFFGLSRRLNSLQEAVSYLGVDILRQLVLVHHLFSECSQSEVCRYHLETLWDHSLCTANLAREIAVSNENADFICNSAYLAGLLHDIGKLVLIRHLPGVYKEIIEEVKQGASQEIAENNKVGTNHAVIGGYLSLLWGLPYTVTQGITCHHQPSIAVEIEKFSPIAEAVWHANRLCKGDSSQSEKYQQLAQKWQEYAHRKENEGA